MQSFRAEWQALYFFEVLIKDRRHARFVRLKRRQSVAHLPTAFREANLIRENGSGGSDDLSGEGVHLFCQFLPAGTSLGVMANRARLLNLAVCKVNLQPLHFTVAVRAPERMM